MWPQLRWLHLAATQMALCARKFTPSGDRAEQPCWDRYRLPPPLYPHGHDAEEDGPTASSLRAEVSHISMSANALLRLRYQFNATVLEAAFGCSVVSNRVGLAVAFCSQAAGIDTFGDQIVAYRIGTAGR